MRLDLFIACGHSMHHTTARCNHVTYYVVMLLKNATVHYLECSAK